MPADKKPYSSGSSSYCDSELSSLIRQYPKQTDEILEKFFHVDTRRHKSDYNSPRPKEVAVIDSRSQNDCPRYGRSLYRDTFQGKYVRPRSSKRRVELPRNDPRPKMNTTTWQRDVYKPHKITGRTETLKPVNKLSENIRTTENDQTVTLYQSDYVPLKLSDQTHPKVHRSELKDIFNEQNNASMQTTSKSHFQKWKAKKNIGYCELPSFTGSLMYPSQKRELQSIMRDSYQSDGSVAPAIPSKGMPSQIKLEGEHDFVTTHRSTYNQENMSGGERALPFSMRGTLPFKHRETMPTETQFQHDFPGFKDGAQPLPPKPVAPRKATINLKLSNKSNFQTVNREIYKGHDVSLLSKSMPCNVPKCGEVPFSLTADTNEEVLSTSRADYKSFPLDSITRTKLIVRPSYNVLNLSDEKGVECLTTNKQFFKDWPEKYTRVRPVVGVDQYTNPETWFRSAEKMSGETVHSSSYLPPLQVDRTESFLPKYVPLNNLGDQDFTTVYSKTFKGTNRNLSKYQAKLLKKELKKYKANECLSKSLTLQPAVA